MAAKSLVAVRILEGVLVLEPWRFLPIDTYTSYNYGVLLKDILDKKYDQFKLDSLKKCMNYHFKEVIAGTSFSLTENIRGDSNTDLVGVVDVFKMSFFSISIEHDGSNCQACLPATSDRNRPNAFQVMMAAARVADNESNIPKVTEQPKNMKEQLMNEVLIFLSEMDCVFPANCGTGANSFVTKLCEMLYFLDGQYSKLEREIGKTKNVSDIFKKRFSGFNVPEKTKHRKRTLSNLSDKKLEHHAVSVREAIQSQVYLDSMAWAKVKLMILDVVDVVEQYCVNLRASRIKSKVSRETHRSEVETRTKTTILPVNKGRLHHALIEVERQVEQAEPYAPVSIREYLPVCGRRRVFEMVEELKHRGMKIAVNCFHYVHHVGGNQTSLHFVWKGRDGEDDGTAINLCMQVIMKIEREAPLYERRITKQHFHKAFGFVADPVALRAIFSELTSDNSAPVNLSAGEIDERFLYAMLCEDTEIMVNLRHQSPDTKKDTFRVFYETTERYLAEDIGVACQERRHGEQLYLAKAVSLKDLHQHVKDRVPADTKIPSVKWLRYQFQPINPLANTAKYYRGTMNIKMMVQKRQVRISEFVFPCDGVPPSFEFIKLLHFV